MTKTRLAQNVAAVLALLVALVGVATVAHAGNANSLIYTTVKDFSPILIAIAAAYLAFCFQQRNAFLASLRELWSRMIGAKNMLIAYTHLTDPDQEAFENCWTPLSIVIDLMRGVYRNVGESDRVVGYFPYEPLHDMRRTLETLGYGNNASSQQRKAARDEILHSWNALRAEFLKEFETPAPRYPITSPDARDPRRA